MKTQKQLLTEHREQLDKRFHEKYPGGKFCLQYRNDRLALHYGKSYYMMHWEPRRPTSHNRYRGISVGYDTSLRPEYHLHHSYYRNNSFGRCNDYDTIGKLLAACKRKDVPVVLIEAFTKRYIDRASEGFEI
jgi:hypothetical protein